jgi:hypothetical protein
MLKAIALSLLFLLAHMSPATAACNHTVKVPWTSAKALKLSLHASSLGETCASTVIVLSVTSAKGEMLWATSRLSQQVLLFAEDGKKTDQTVKAALKQWLTIGQKGERVTTKMLPDWPEGQDAPTSEGEFGFFASETSSREFLLEQKTANHPMFCFVQGMESEACIIATKNGEVVDIGGYRFPG